MRAIYEKVGKTAFVTSQWRALEAEQPNPLFSDHVANIFLDNETFDTAAVIAQASPSTQLLLRYRTLYFDQVIMEQMKMGRKQFLLLGSGLDTRPVRLGSDSAVFYEVDQEHVLKYKEQQLEKFGYYKASRFIYSDYTRTDFITMLKNEGFDFSEPTFILWEGNIFYLTYDDILLVLGKLQQHLADFTITFDYLSRKLIEKATGFRKSQDLLNSFSNIGAPWNTGFDDIGELAGKTGLSIINNFLIAAFINSLDAEFRVDTTLLDDHSICTLKK